MKLVAVEISKQFGKKKVLEKVSLQFEQGQIFGLFGRNGSGKSTLLKILFGSLKADAGELYLDQELFDPYKAFKHQRLAYLPQQNMFHGTIKVRDLIPLMIPDGNLQDKVFYAPGIEAYTRKRVGSLSEGERVHLGVVLCCHLPHPVLVLDEPFSMTDPLTIERIKDQIVAASKTKAVLITDHYYHQVLDIAAKSAVLTDGKLQQIETVQDLKTFGYTR